MWSLNNRVNGIDFFTEKFDPQQIASKDSEARGSHRRCSIRKLYFPITFEKLTGKTCVGA